jgi:hypothetical protein
MYITFLNVRNVYLFTVSLEIKLSFLQVLSTDSKNEFIFVKSWCMFTHYVSETLSCSTFNLIAIFTKQIHADKHKFV